MKSPKMATVAWVEETLSRVQAGRKFSTFANPNKGRDVAQCTLEVCLLQTMLVFLPLKDPLP
jgi:hypothetical protein